MTFSYDGCPGGKSLCIPVCCGEQLLGWAVAFVLCLCCFQEHLCDPVLGLDGPAGLSGSLCPSIHSSGKGHGKERDRLFLKCAQVCPFLTFSQLVFLHPFVQ